MSHEAEQTVWHWQMGYLSWIRVFITGFTENHHQLKAHPGRQQKNSSLTFFLSSLMSRECCFMSIKPVINVHRDGRRKYIMACTIAHKPTGSHCARMLQGLSWTQTGKWTKVLFNCCIWEQGANNISRLQYMTHKGVPGGHQQEKESYSFTIIIFKSNSNDSWPLRSWVSYTFCNKTSTFFGYSSMLKYVLTARVAVRCPGNYAIV